MFLQMAQAYETLKTSFIENSNELVTSKSTQLNIYDTQVERWGRVVRSKKDRKLEILANSSEQGMFATAVDQQKSSSDEQAQAGLTR